MLEDCLVNNKVKTCFFSSYVSEGWNWVPGAMLFEASYLGGAGCGAIFSFTHKSLQSASLLGGSMQSWAELCPAALSEPTVASVGLRLDEVLTGVHVRI